MWRWELNMPVPWLGYFIDAISFRSRNNARSFGARVSRARRGRTSSNKKPKVSPVPWEFSSGCTPTIRDETVGRRWVLETKLWTRVVGARLQFHRRCIVEKSNKVWRWEWSKPCERKGMNQTSQSSDLKRFELKAWAKGQERKGTQRKGGNKREKTKGRKQKGEAREASKRESKG